jgi:polysaccharide biosynthesis protein PelD
LNDPVPNAPKPERPWRLQAHLPVLPPITALVEIAVLFSVLLGAEWLYPGIELFDIRPHPFWVPVLLLSLQYGTVSGLLAASVAIALRAWAGFPEQSGSESYFTYLVKIWIEPILWIGAAVLLGQFRMRQIGQKQELVFQVGELASQRGALADYAKNLRDHSTALERQIAGRNEPGIMQTLQAIDAAYERAATGNDEQLSETLAQVMSLALPGSEATLYVADPSGLRLAANTDRRGNRELRSWVAPADPLFRTIALEAQGVSVLTAEGERRLGGAGVAAVPVFGTGEPTGASGKHVVGMLKMETVLPANLGDACLPALATIARAFAPALERRLASSGQRPVDATAVAAIQPAQPAQRIWRHLRWFGRHSGLAKSDAAPPAKVRSGTPVTS